MYRKGHSADRIAVLVEAAPSTVNYHISVARALEPGLDAEHESTAGAKPSHVTAQGLERMQQLVALVQETGRYPSRQSSSDTERALAAWPQRRRDDARAGRLAPEYRNGLAVLPGWEIPPRGEPDEATWRQQLAALVASRAPGNDWPRHKAIITGEEHTLGVWLDFQRYKASHGELDEAKVDRFGYGCSGLACGQETGPEKATKLSRGRS